jgi:hypothetical protein
MWKSEGFPVRHDFPGLTHRAERYFRFYREGSGRGGFFYTFDSMRARLLRQFHDAGASCELTNGVEQNFNELTSAPNVQAN